MDNENIFLGANIDTRSPEQKAKDYYQSEVVATAEVVNWVEKPESMWRKFPDQNQNGSGSCVAQTARKLLRVLFFLRTGKDLDFSASHIYQRRVNKPQGGMIGVDCLEICGKGVSLNALMPSDLMTDEQMDSVKVTDFDTKIADALKTNDKFIQLNIKDFEGVASTIQKTGKAVMVWFYFTHSEWSKMTPDIQVPDLDMHAASRHSVAAVDYLLYGGKKYLLIEDSAHFGGLTRRLVSEDFFKSRNFFTGYLMNFKYDTTVVLKPVVTISKTLKKGLKADKDVVNLQDVLKFLGHFATNLDSTGNFGSITEKAVKDFQTSKGLVVDGIVGPKTIQALKDSLN